MSFRESEIAISNELRWKLARIVAATQDPGRWDAKKQSVESLVDGILTYWISEQHPQLDKLWLEREEINDRAHKAVNEKGKV